MEVGGSRSKCTYMITGEGLALDDDLPTVRCGAVEASHEEMQVGRQCLHDTDLAGHGTDKLCRLFLDGVVDMQPWRQASMVFGKMAKDALGGPGIEVAVDIFFGASRLQA
jgi:hypothetical protein